MNNALKNFISYLNKNEIHFDVPRDNDNLVIIKNYLKKNSSILANIMIGVSDDGSKDASICLWGLGKVENITYELLEKVNELNCNFRWFKIYINDNGNLELSYDFILCKNSTDQLLELMIRGLGIADDCYPQLMKCIWA